MNHRDSGAFERKAPLRTEINPTLPSPSLPAKIREAKLPTFTPTEREVLVVASKVKKYIRDRSGFNTSDSVMEVLSDKIRAIAKKAIEEATRQGRKTVMERDF